MKSALVVIPTYNERDNLPVLVPQLMEYPEVSILIVDDHSPDGTGDVAEALARQFSSRVHVLHRTSLRGLGRSYVDGFARALAMKPDVICQMDADLSHDPRYLRDMLAATTAFDVVIGSRYLNGISVVNWPLHRVVLSLLANKYIRTLLRLPVSDCTSGFRCWRHEALSHIPLEHIRSEGYAFIVETLFEAIQLGQRIGEVPIIFVERRAGRSKLTAAVLLESIVTPWRLLVRRPIPGARRSLDGRPREYRRTTD